MSCREHFGVYELRPDKDERMSIFSSTPSGLDILSQVILSPTVCETWSTESPRLTFPLMNPFGTMH
jgi:hypothetical protein